LKPKTFAADSSTPDPASAKPSLQGENPSPETQNALLKTPFAARAILAAATCALRTLLADVRPSPYFRRLRLVSVVTLLTLKSEGD
jgi:hypothetical protein